MTQRAKEPRGPPNISLHFFSQQQEEREDEGKKEGKKKEGNAWLPVVVVAKMLPGVKKYFQPLAFNY